MALQPFGPGRFFNFLILTQLVGILGRGISPSQRRYLHTEQRKHRINAHKHLCLEWDSNPRPQCSSGPRRYALDLAVTEIRHYFEYVIGKYHTNRRCLTGQWFLPHFRKEECTGILVIPIQKPTSADPTVSRLNQTCLFSFITKYQAIRYCHLTS
jgi:hypothetical protein